MSITASGCEGTHTDGRVGDGLVGPPRRGHTTGIDLGYASIPQGRFLAECSAAVTGTEVIEWDGGAELMHPSSTVQPWAWILRLLAVTVTFTPKSGPKLTAKTTAHVK